MHSILTQTDLQRFSREFNAKVDFKSFEALFKLRLKDKQIKIPRGLEYNFTGEKRAQARKWIETYHVKMLKIEELDLKKQKERLKKAKEKLKKKKTKTAENEARIAEKKISKLEWKIGRRKVLEPKPYDSRVYPFYYAPLLIMEKGERIIRAFRFHCRPKGQSAHFDKKSYSTYKAKRESLTEEYFERISYHSGKPSLWEPLFGENHGVLLLKKFYENVPKHLFEKRKLKKGEKEESVTVAFEPKDMDWQLVPCLYDNWISKDKKEKLSSFAIITDEAPKSVQKAGYHRSPISLPIESLNDWLLPAGKSNQELQALLTPSSEIIYSAVG